MNDVFIIDKPAGKSSFWVVDKIKKFTGVSKVGHAGTLDPIATGVLTVFTGEAVKASDIFMSGDKTYEVTAKLGERTDTLDAEGSVVERSDAAKHNITKEMIMDVLKKFTGEIRQTPPMYSALKKDGKPLYEYARKGISVDREKRKIFIYDIDLLGFELPFLKLRVNCSKGTYIRALVDDIGVELGTFAHVTELRRTRSGAFDIKQAQQIGPDMKSISLEDAVSMTLPVFDIELKLAEKLAKGYLFNPEEAGVESKVGVYALQSRTKNGDKKIAALIKDGKVGRIFNYSEWSSACSTE
ncbi:MAG: tRNA pseudouridine(55) synthase TruB [Pseudomonadota bacterium]